MICKKHISIALLSVAFCFNAAALWAAGEKPEIFMNSVLQPIELDSAGSQGIPIFINTGPIAGHPLEFFIWRENGSDVAEYLDDQLQWKSGLSTMGFTTTLPSYTNLILPLPSDGATAFNPFKLHVCIDSAIDGNVPGKDQAEQSYVCAETLVIPSCQPQDLKVTDCNEYELKEDEIFEIDYVQGQDTTIAALHFRDNCGMFATCNVTEVPEFVDSALINEAVIGSLSLAIVDNPSPDTGILRVNCNIGDEVISKDITVILNASQEEPGGCDGTIGFEYNGRVTSKITEKTSTSQLDISVVCREGGFPPKSSPYDLADAVIEPQNGSCFSARKVGSDGGIRITHPSSSACSGTLKVTSGSTSASLPISFSEPIPSPTPPSPTTSEISVDPSKISESMDSGQQKSETIGINCINSSSWSAPSSCSAEAFGGSWLSVSDCTPGVTTNVTVSIDSTGLNPGQEYEGSVRISACGTTKTVPIKLTVQGVCEATKVVLDPSSLSISVEQGKNAAARTMEVKDDCGKAVSFDVVDIDADWITTDPAAGQSGSGELGLFFNTSGLDVKKGYEAAIKLEAPATDKYAAQTLILDVELDVEEEGSQPEPPAGDYISLENNVPYIDQFGAGQIKIYRILSGSRGGSSVEDSYPLSLAVEDFDSSKRNGYDYYVILSYGDTPPDISDYNEIHSKWMDGSINCSGKYDGVYYDFCRNVTRMLKVRENYDYGCWYLWIYNLDNSMIPKLRITYGGPSQ